MYKIKLKNDWLEWIYNKKLNVIIERIIIKKTKQRRKNKNGFLNKKIILMII